MRDRDGMNMTDGYFSRRVHTYEQENAWILSPAFIEPLVPAVFGGGKMLDVCAGTGVVAEYAQSIGWVASALDNNEDMLRKVDVSVSTFWGDAHHMPFLESTFDLVTCRQGIQYLDFADAIQEMLRVSRGQVRMLHAFIAREDIEYWNHLFEIAHGPKRTFFSCDMLNAAINRCTYSGIELKFLKSRERFRKNLRACAAIDEFLMDFPSFATNYHVKNHNDSFFYDLNWVVHIITK